MELYSGEVTSWICTEENDGPRVAKSFYETYFQSSDKYFSLS